MSWGFALISFVFWPICGVSRPCLSLSSKTACWPTLIQKGLVFYTLPLLNPWYLGFGIVYFIVFPHYALFRAWFHHPLLHPGTCFYVHLSLHALTNLFVIHRIRKDPPLSLWTGHQPQSYTEAHHLPYLCSNSSRSPSSVIHPYRNHHFNPWKRTPATPTPPCPCRHPGMTVLEKDRESCCGKVSPRGTSFRFLPRICSKVCFKQFWHHKRILSVDFSAIMATSTLKESV